MTMHPDSQIPLTGKRRKIRNEELETVLGELAHFDLSVKPSVSNGGRHVRISWQVSGKPERTISVAATGRDVRSPRNACACARRLLRIDGAQPKPVRVRPPRVPRQRPIVVAAETKARPSVVPVAAPEPPKIRMIAQERLSPMFTRIWQALAYDRAIPLTTLAASLDRNRGALSAELHTMKARGLVRNLPDRASWIRNPLP
jgi:hypothetical protein